jgi:plastocyanin domain-containing protein
MPARLPSILALFALLALFPACEPSGSAPTGAPAKPAAVVTPTGGRIDVTVTADGFVPSRIAAKVGQPLTLSITRRAEPSCATEIVIKDYGINTPLPKDKTVEVTLTPTKAGNVRFACAMDMIAGELVVE